MNPDVRFNLKNLKLGTTPKVFLALGLVFLAISLFTNTYRKFLYFAAFVCWSFVGVEGYKQYQVYKQNPPMVCQLAENLKEKDEEETKEILAGAIDFENQIDCKLGPFELKNIKTRDVLLILLILIVSFIVWQYLIVSKKSAAPAAAPQPQLIGYPLIPLGVYPTGLLPKPPAGPTSIKEKVSKALLQVEDKVQIPSLAFQF